ncbi:MAG TPA: Mur ligase family protein [Candidatus Saccharibacteria bacterium]|nr:Mur ligase family protein [Candidatus Saccharibacteria bacterium]
MKFQSFKEVEQYLGALPFVPRFRGSERLDYARQVLHNLGDPQDAAPMIHIAGTSGKGSTAYYAAQLLYASDYTVGTIVSPHVTSVAERTQINGRLLDEDEYCQHFSAFVTQLTRINTELTYIEFLTVFSYWLFARLAVDYMVIEVGIGGRLDTTNVSDRPDKVAVITDVGFDHTELLGNTLTEIAGEKAGIIVEGGSVVMHSQSSEIMAVIRRVVRDKKAALLVEDTVIDATASLPSYQVRNSSLALAAVNRRLSLDGRPAVASEAVNQALQCVIPGRFEGITIQEVPALLDAAHNPQKIHAFVEAYQQMYPNIPCIIVAAFGENKSSSVAESLAILRGVSNHLVVTEFSVEGKQLDSIDRTIFASMATDEGYDVIASRASPHDAIAVAVPWAREHNAMILVTGSFYLISAVRPSLRRIVG